MFNRLLAISFWLLAENKQTTGSLNGVALRGLLPKQSVGEGGSAKH